jgi:hypothetical protein
MFAYHFLKATGFKTVILARAVCLNGMVPMVDDSDNRMAVDQFEGFLKSVDQNVDQAPENGKGANSISELTPFNY